MSRNFASPTRRCLRRVQRRERRGVVLALTALSMVMIIGFVALSVDIGTIAMVQSRMQKAVDAAALAASQEIAQAVVQAGVDQGSGSTAATAAESAARAKAVEVAAANGVYLDSDADIKFGNRAFNTSHNRWEVAWGQTPYNAVKVSARRDQPDMSKPDGRVRLAFAWIFGHGSQDILASATAYVQARDIVLVLDYSGSMNDDSTFAAFPALGQTPVETNMQNIYTAMGSFNLGSLPMTPAFLTVSGQAASGTVPHIDVTFGADAGTGKNYVSVVSTSALSRVILRFDNGSEYMYSGLSGKTGTFYPNSTNASKRIDKVWVKSGTNSTTSPGSSYTSSYYGEMFEDSDAKIKAAFGLTSLTCPYGASWTGTSSSAFFYYVKNDSQVKTAGYCKKYGKLTFINYLLTQRAQFTQTPDFWKAPCYPCHALKTGCSQFCDFVSELNFNDRLGLVIYSTESRIEKALSGIAGEPTVDLGSNWLTYNIGDIDTIQKHKQAGHYSPNTAIGLGLKDARTLLTSKRRVGAKQVVFLMTDGLANVYPSGWSLPAGWNWTAMTDLDGDGVSDYSTTNKSVQYTIYEAKQLIDQGAMIHTLCVGSGADTTPMKCIAAASGGKCIIVPGGTSTTQMQADLEAAFAEVAGKVPPPELTNDE